MGGIPDTPKPEGIPELPHGHPAPGPYDASALRTAAAIALVSVRPPYPLLRLMCNKCAWFTLLDMCTATLLTLSTSTF